jgi:hypothetical protein
MKYSILTFMVLAINWARAQEPVVNGNDAPISKGIVIDSPRLLLSWGSPIQEDPDYHLKIKRFKRLLTVVKWDSVNIFDMPMDSIFMHYVTSPNPQTMHWQGFHSIYLYFKPEYTDRMRPLFEHLFGPPKTSRSKRGRFVYIWQTTRFFAIISNRKSYGALNGHVNAYIGIPHYIL